MWMDVTGHDTVVKWFRRVLLRRRLASTYLFVGPSGIGKRMFARRLAQALFCEGTSEEELVVCGRCPSCELITAGNHPDLLEVGLPVGKRILPIDLFVGPPDKRHREGLCHDMALKPYMASRRVAIIDDADAFNAESANCLLKTLEEPPPNSLLLLIGTSAARQLPTIRSRAQIIRFQPLPEADLMRLLLEQQLATTPDEAQRLARLADGSLARARQMTHEEQWHVRNNAIALLTQPMVNVACLAEQVFQFAQEAGKEAAARRFALTTLFGLIAEYFREQLRGDPDGWSAPRCVAQIDRCLVAEAQVERNLHLQTVVQCWAEDLAALGERN